MIFDSNWYSDTFHLFLDLWIVWLKYYLRIKNLALLAKWKLLSKCEKLLFLLLIILH